MIRESFELNFFKEPSHSWAKHLVTTLTKTKAKVGDFLKRLSMNVCINVLLLYDESLNGPDTYGDQSGR